MIRTLSGAPPTRSPNPGAYTRAADTVIHTDAAEPWSPDYDEPPASLARRADGESQTSTGKPTQGTQLRHARHHAPHGSNDADKLPCVINRQTSPHKVTQMCTLQRNFDIHRWYLNWSGISTPHHPTTRHPTYPFGDLHRLHHVYVSETHVQAA